MHRVDTTGHVLNLFDDGDPGVPRLPTAVDAAILNALQEEIAGTVEGAGVTLVKGTNTQLLDAIGILLGQVTSPPPGRLSLTTALPVTSSDVTGATTVYYVPMQGNRIMIYDGTNWRNRTITELSQATTDATKSPLAVAANKNYDMFVWRDSSTMRCTRGPTWDAGAVAGSDTARGTGAGSTELELFEGRYVNKNAITNGPAARTGLYVGSVRSDASSQINDSYLKRHVWNMYNRCIRPMHVTELTDSWTYSTATYRQANGSAANQVNFLIGIAGDGVTGRVSARAKNSTTTAQGVVTGIGVDSTSAVAFGALTAYNKVVDTAESTMNAFVDVIPGIGSHYLAWLERGAGADTQTWFGDTAAATTLLRQGLNATMLG